MFDDVYDAPTHRLKVSGTNTGQYNATPPTYTSGQSVTPQYDANEKVTQATLIYGEDAVNNRIVVEQRFQYGTVNSATTTLVKTGAGFLHAITLVGGTAGAITAYDNTTASGAVIIPTFTPGAVASPTTIIVDASFFTGLTIVTSAATVLAFSWR